MDAVIWVEVLSRHYEVLARLRCSAPEVRIGRGYDNDVVLDDPHVAVAHLRIFRDAEEKWVAEDLATINGLFVDGAKQRVARVSLESEHFLRIGQTTLRVRLADHALAPEVPMQSAPRLWPRLILLVALLVGLSVLELWLADTGEFKLSRYLAPLLAVGLMIGLWSSIWALLTRLFAGRAQFGRQLGIALVGFLILSLTDSLVAIGAYALSFTALATFNYVLTWSILAAMAFFHLLVVSPAHWKLKAGVLTTLAALGIASTALTREEAAVHSQPATLSRLQPPALRLVPAQDPEVFFAASAELKTELDELRKEDPEQGVLANLVESGD